jgi:hypothetical protein
VLHQRCPEDTTYGATSYDTSVPVRWHRCVCHVVYICLFGLDQTWPNCGSQDTCQFHKLLVQLAQKNLIFIIRLNNKIYWVENVYLNTHTTNPRLKSSVFWDVTPCSPLKTNRRFCGTCRLQFQGQRIIGQARLYLLPASVWFLSWLIILRPWRWRRHVPPKRQLNFNGLHGVISHKTELFIATAVRTWNP